MQAFTLHRRSGRGISNPLQTNKQTVHCARKRGAAQRVFSACDPALPGAGKRKGLHSPLSLRHDDMII